MPERTLTIFDPNITPNSPAGSCLLKMLQAASPAYRLRLFTITTSFEASPRIRIYKLPLPLRPVFLQNILFSFFSVVGYFFLSRGQRGLSISTQGACPFCDIGYSHNPHKLFLTRYRRSIAGGFLTRAARILNYRWIAFMEAIAFRRARVIVVPSHGLAAELIESHSEAIAPKLRVIVNPVDCDFFAPPAAPTQPRPFTFAFCALGNFDWKGLGLIIEAMSRGIPAHLQVIGGGESEIRAFRARVESVGLADRVTFAGMQRDIRPYLWASDVFVFPSVHESFGLVCLQAAAAGLPLIATSLYALTDLLRPGVSGWLVERTADSLASAMRAALADPSQTARMGHNAKLLAQKYHEPVFQQHWLDLIDGFYKA